MISKLKMFSFTPLALALTLTSTLSSTTVEAQISIDYLLRQKLAHYNITTVTPPPAQNPAMVELGRNLFFEKEISGRRNISCSTCHSPVLGSGDAQTQSRGQGAIGLGMFRRANHNEFFQHLPRNTASLWNRGVAQWRTMFWDGRLGQNDDGVFFSPADPDPINAPGVVTPQTFTNALAAFSIIPVTPDEEMRGFPGQLDVFGNPNEMSELTNADFTQIWPLVTARITNNANYDDLLAAAFPGRTEEDLDITDLANALGAFMTDAFTALDSPFDRYLAGDRKALSTNQKKGALLFYGKANCVACHSGGLQTDFDFHNIAAPQVGTGRGATAIRGRLPEGGDGSALDLGRGAITGNVAENFRFRTPSLRNIELESPFFHNGAYDKLEDAVRHHFNPVSSLYNYDVSQIDLDVSIISSANSNSGSAFQNDPRTISLLIKTLDPEIRNIRSLSRNQFSNLMDFLSALTDPSSLNLLETVPDQLPSGLTLAD